MTPVDQTTFAAEGNCFSACVASILDLPIERVPWFMGPVENGKGWWDRFCAWCDANGVRTTYNGDPTNVPAGYAIMTGRSPRSSRYHAVVALDGAMVHDPHVGDRRGVLDVLDWITVEWIK